MIRLKQMIIVMFLLINTQIVIASSAVYTASVKGDFEVIYKNIHTALEKNRLFVVFEPDIGSNIANFEKRWGKDYNRNKLDRIKSMVFCNAWYANQVSNLDVSMTAMCPLHITLTYKDKITSVHFVRPDYIAKGSNAASVAHELTQRVIKSIKEGISASKNK